MSTNNIYLPPRSLTINYCSAPPGSGKTRQAVHRRVVDYLERFEKILLVQPTRNLIDKTVAEEIQKLSKPPYVKIFHKGTVGKNVGKLLDDYATETPDEIREVVITTHAALPYVKHFEKKDRWHVIIDEEMQVVRYQQHKVPQMHCLITDHLRVTQVNSIYGRVEVVNDDALRAIAQNEDDDEILETLSGTCRILRNENWDTFVNIEQYDRLRRGEKRVLAFHSVLTPKILEGFNSVHMMSAKFEDSQIYKVWGSQGVEFKPDLEFAKSLRYTEHPNGGAVTIYYITDHQWSRYRRLKELADGTTLSDHMIQAAKKLFPTGRFLWHANNSLTRIFLNRRRNVYRTSLMDLIHSWIFMISCSFLL